MQRLAMFVVTLFLSLSPMMAQAADSATVTADYSQLTDDEKSKFLAAIKQAPVVPPAPTTVEQVEKLANIGTAVGRGLASAAREMGVVANEFVNTDVGKLAAGLIVWNYFGADFVKVIGSVFVTIVGCIFVASAPIFYFTKTAQNMKITTEYHPEKKTIFGNPVKVSVKNEWVGPKFDDGIPVNITAVAGAIVLFIAGFLMIVT